MTSKNLVLEGTWDEIVRHADRFAGQRVRLTILTGEVINGAHEAESPARRGTLISFGMFPGTVQPTEADFRSAEFHSDPDDGLDWA